MLYPIQPQAAARAATCTSDFGSYLHIDKFCVDRKMVYEILQKYDYSAPFTGDISSYNKYLKYLMKAVGLTEEIKRETKIAGIIHTERIQKYKLIGAIQVEEHSLPSICFEVSHCMK